MVYVKLLKNVAEGGVEYIAGKRDAGGSKLVLKTTSVRGKVTAYTKGTIVTMHEASAEKWLKRGLCEVVDAPAEETA
jgi:hypothetical protein